MIKVIVASKNPVKINAAKIGFEAMFKYEKFEFVGVSVESEVSNQPLSCNETKNGAINRVNNAEIYIKDADYWVGIEGGIEVIGEEMEAFAWVVIKSKDKFGKSKTATFHLPKKIIELINQGKELGEADDIVFGKNNSKQKDGAVGLLTDNAINRTHFYSNAMTLALIPFKNQDLYLE
jgi:inosine/xanthosine triphosphatase